MGVPLASALPPSMGTTGLALPAGTGLVRGALVAVPVTAVGLPSTEASTAPAAVPATATTLTTTGTRRLDRPDGSG